MITPNARRWFWGTCIVINSLMMLFNAQLAMYDWTVVNFLSALGCWVGYFIADKEFNKEKEDGD